MTNELPKFAPNLGVSPGQERRPGSQYNYGGDPNDVVPALLTIRQFCRLTGIGRTSAYLSIKNRQIEVCKIGRRTLITRASAEALIERLLINGSKP